MLNFFSTEERKRHLGHMGVSKLSAKVFFYNWTTPVNGVILRLIRQVARISAALTDVTTVTEPENKKKTSGPLVPSMLQYLTQDQLHSLTFSLWLWGIVQIKLIQQQTYSEQSISPWHQLWRRLRKLSRDWGIICQGWDDDYDDDDDDDFIVYQSCTVRRTVWQRVTLERNTSVCVFACLSLELVTRGYRNFTL